MSEISTLYADVNGNKTALTITDSRIESGVEWIDGNEYVRLSEGQDLNDITQNGTYVAASDAIAQSILHKPDIITSKFKLIVSDTIGSTYDDGSYKRQQIISHNYSYTFSRLKVMSNTDWRDWEKVVYDTDLKSKVLNFTASNNTSVNTSYKIIQSGNVCVANIYVTSLPTISTADWLTVATMPVNAAQNVTFDAYLKSGSTTNDIEVRSGLITENKVRVYVGSDDTGKTFRAAIPFISL